MKVRISLDAESDLADGFWFYENQEPGLGTKFRLSVKAEIRSLEVTGGTHSIRHGYHRLVCKKFPFNVYYKLVSTESLIVTAVFSQKRGPKWIAKRLGKKRE